MRFTEPLPREIRVEPSRQGARYRLPARRLGKLRLVGLLPAGFGLSFSSFAVFWMLGASGLLGDKTTDFGSLLFSAFGIPFLLAGLLPLGLGMFILAGRCDVELDGPVLRVTERAGPFRWRRQRAVEGLQQLLVSSEPVEVNGQPVTRGPLADFAALSGDFGARKPWLVALGYPKDWLLLLAADLAQRLRLQGLEVSAGEGNLPPVEESRRLTGAGVDADQPVQPADSRVKLEPQGDGVLLVVPPMGLVKGSKGLFVFGALWCGIVGLISAVFLYAGFTGEFKAPKDALIAIGLLSVFWAVGLGLLAGAINMGKRRGLISVNPRELKVARQSPFGTRTWSWSRDQIQTLGVGPSGMEVNGRPVNELQVHVIGKKKTGFFSERDDEELRWMATVLRHTLQVARRRDDSDAQ